MYCMLFLLPLTKSITLNSGCCLYSPFGTEALIPRDEKFPADSFQLRPFQESNRPELKGAVSSKVTLSPGGDLFLKSDFSEGQCELQSFHWNWRSPLLQLHCRSTLLHLILLLLFPHGFFQRHLVGRLL